MIEIFSGRHGNPEGTFVGACRTMEEMAPAVMWFDEIEMGITSKTDDAAATLGRIFAFFLTWMQEKTRGLFVAATANRIDLLPAEMIRKGRFDEVFFVDLPGEEERARDLQDPPAASAASIPSRCRSNASSSSPAAGPAPRSSSASSRPSPPPSSPTASSPATTCSTPRPRSSRCRRTMKEQVEHIRAWALDRAVRTAPRTGGPS